MNPFKWKREHQIALLLAIVVGISLGVLLGYLAYATSRGAGGALSFESWISHPIRGGAHWWGLFGGSVGASFVYLKRLLSN